MQNEYSHNPDFFPQLEFRQLRARAEFLAWKHPIIYQISLQNFMRNYGGICRYAVVLELYEFDPETDPWKEYLGSGEIQGEAELTLREAELSTSKLSDNLRNIAIAGLIFDASVIIPDKEVYIDGHPLDSTIDLKDQWGFYERFPSEELPLNISSESAWCLFHPQPTESKIRGLLPCRPGTKWNDITITLVTPDSVEITTPEGRRRFPRQTLGMHDGRSKNLPGALWKLFRIFCSTNGVVSTKTYPLFDPRLPERARRLHKHLKNLFGISDPLWPHYKKNMAYQAEAKFRSAIPWLPDIDAIDSKDSREIKEMIERNIEVALREPVH